MAGLLFGYIDPVSGMTILQGLIAGAIAFLGFFRRSRATATTYENPRQPVAG